jgi:diguanylate cyclase (GGDEF)-like protein
MTGKTIRLLIVDDDDDDLYLINDALSEVTETRYEVTAVNSALAAMAKLAADSFDAIISDYRLGPVTGIDFIKNVRLAGIDTPIVLLTGLSGHLIDLAALEAGASDFLPKASLSGTVLDRSLRYALAHADRQRLLNAVLKTTVSGMAVLDGKGELTLWNPRFTEFAEAAFGGAPDRLARLVDLAMRNGAKDIAVGERTAEVHCMALPAGGSVLALHDVTARVVELRERELAEQRIRKLAMHDVLTDLPNRAAFNGRLDQCLERAAAAKSRLAVLSFDFNRFKEVNDLFGHAAGDELLRKAAERLLPLLSEREFAARLGGDEFVLVHEAPSDDSAIALAARIAEQLAQPIDWNGQLIEAGVSIGVAYYPEHGQRREELLANADLAMYRAKSNMGCAYCVFDAGMDEFIRERRKIGHELRTALHDGELRLYCQPQYRALSGELSGFEVLLRWHSRSRGIVSPANFILVAEDTGLIKDIDDWVMREACLIATQWSAPTKVAVNVSARAICHPGIIETVRGVLLETGLAPARLELEVTETALINDLSRALHNLRQIKASGVSIAMDDFGTGYSSLSLLSSFPFDKIKVDRSFVQAVGRNARADSIFKAVAGMGKALSVPVLVEGVETLKQLEFVQSLHCDEVQGYYCGRPIASENVEDLLGILAGGSVFAADAARIGSLAPGKQILPKTATVA